MKCSIVLTLVWCLVIAVGVGASPGAHAHPNTLCASLEDRNVAGEIAEKIRRLMQTTSAEDGQGLVVELGQLFDRDPCGLVRGAEEAGLTDHQMASLVGAFPVQFVDRPCAKSVALGERIRKLNVLADERRVALHKLLAPALETYGKACRAQGQRDPSK